MGKTPRDSEDALLKKITVANYRQDPYYDPIVRAVEGLLREKGFVAPLELFIRMDLLSPESVENWRRGRVPYLEKVIRCNLSKASRILRILRMHAHDLDLKPSLTVYKRWTKGSRPLLRFSKTGDHNVEDAYARHFVSPRKGSGAGVKEVLVDSAGTHTTGDQPCSANNFAGAESGMVSPSPAPCTSQGGDTDSRRFYLHRSRRPLSQAADADNGP